MKALLLALLLIFNYPHTLQSSTGKNKTDLELHNIFNKKLIKPLKLGFEKNKLLLESLNHFSRKMLSIEDELNKNLSQIKTELKKQQTAKKDNLMRLNNTRIQLIKQLTQLEKMKLEKIKSFLTPKKLSYYFILKEKLMTRFKKAIDISALTEE